jgi:hypothetical protein
MSLPCITVPSVEVSYFDGTNFVSWKSQMSSYLCEMNPQVWWMVDVGLSHALKDCPQTQAKKNCLYLEVYTSNALYSALNAEIKDEIEINYGLLERANLLWKVLEQMFDPRNDKRSLSSVPENMSSSSIHIDQNQEEQSNIQKDKVKTVSLEKLDCLVSQTRLSGFVRIETSFAEEDDCSTSNSDIDDDDDDDDDTDDENDDKEFLLEFKKPISKHMKLQKRHENLLYSHNKFMDSYPLLESAHEVMVTKVKHSEPHTCTYAPYSIDLSCVNSYCSQVKPSCDEHVLVETSNNLIASENVERKRENKMLKMELSRLRVKCHVQPSQDNPDHIVKKVEKG